MSYVVKQDGEILMRPANVTEDLYDNIFDAFMDTSGERDEIGRFIQVLQNDKEDTILFSNGSNELAYTYIPLESVDGWFLVSVVPASALREEADRILQSSQIALFFLVLILVICGIFVFLIQMAKAASEAKTAFLSSVSHDICTPMNAIIGFLTLMRDEVENPAMMREYIDRIDAASQHLLGLINDVLDMNKIESGNTTLSLAEMNVADIINEINAIIRLCFLFIISGSFSVYL